MESSIGPVIQSREPREPDDQDKAIEWLESRGYERVMDFSNDEKSNDEKTGWRRQQHFLSDDELFQPSFRLKNDITLEELKAYVIKKETTTVLENRQIDGLIHEMLGNQVKWYLYPFGPIIPEYTRELKNEEINDLCSFFRKYGN
ncbi:hypothetical protein [Brevibacillus sp. 179-C9.3 HS]|uniref:hypothetical protein n=1 Tax=unclassified Brevibacillus TaxID=2684853 RepID=UPI00399F271A